MTIEYIQLPYYVIPFEYHNMLKEELLESIDKHAEENSNFIENKTSKIAKTDFFVGNETRFESEYFQTIKEHLSQPFDEFFEKYIKETEVNVSGEEITGFDVTNFWFQQYGKKDHHGWHIHFGNDISVVYYLELPEGTPTTSFKTANGKDISANAKEGDFIFFPSVAPHCSPENLSDDRKTIISFNLTLNGAT